MGRRLIYTDECKKAIIDDVKAVAAKLGGDRLSSKEYYAHGKYGKTIIKVIFKSWKEVMKNAGLKYRGYSEEEIIADVRRVSILLNKKKLDVSTYLSYGKYSEGTFYKSLGSWNNTIIKAGLVPLRVSDNDLLIDMKLVASNLKSSQLLNNTYVKYGKYSVDTVSKRFGSWANALNKAGLRGRNKLSDKELIEDIRRIAFETNQDFVAIHQYEKLGKYSIGSHIKNFGSWNKAIVNAGLIPYSPFSEKELIDDLRQVAKQISPQRLTTTNYDLKGNYNSNTMRYRFGSWDKAIRKSGITLGKKVYSRNQSISDEELINEMQRVASEAGEKTFDSIYYKNNDKYLSTCIRRFGSWNKALKKAGIENKKFNRKK